MIPEDLILLAIATSILLLLHFMGTFERKSDRRMNNEPVT